MSEKKIRLAAADLDALNARLDDVVAAAKTESARRHGILAAVRETCDASREEARARLQVERRGGLAIGRALSQLEDTIVAALFRCATTHIFPMRVQTDAERIAILATGGYGRGALAPFSDIDLLFLLPYKQTSWGESVVEFILYMLWDLRQKVGQAVRSVDECVRLAHDDITIRTAVLEARHLVGDEALSQELKTRLRKEVFAKTGLEFVESKLAERDRRHEAEGGTRYLVEPNIKDGKGGLRDLQTLFWIGKYLYGVDDPADLIAQGVFTEEEFRRVLKARRYLWTARCHLHFLAGRAEERLSFDVQPAMAEHLGYTDRSGSAAVERFMKHYFLNAKEVGDLTRIFCAALEDQQKKSAPRLGRLIQSFFRRKAADVKGFTAQGGRLDVASDTLFETDPVNLIRIFHIAQDSTLDIHPNALKLISRSLNLIGPELRDNAEANRLFSEILTSRKDPEGALRRMNEAGVLGRFIPDFGRIVCLMQFNMYHHYTADEHLIRAIGILHRIENQELVEDHPVSSRLLGGVSSRKVLYLALFCHDIAKGRKEDHSTAGARIARRLGRRLALSDGEIDTTAWLVQHHLVMSDIAQKRDIYDPKTVRDFADIVQSLDRLRLLLILTVADIRAVGPGVWNGWKGELLRQLFYATEEILSGGHTELNQKARVAIAKDALAGRLSDWSVKERTRYLDRHYDPYWLALDTDTHVRHAELMRGAGRGESAFGFHAVPDPFRDVTQVTVTMPDHPGIFARIAGALSLAQANIVDAKIFTTTDGMALDTLWIQDQEGSEIAETTRIGRLEASVHRALKGEVLVPRVLDERRKRKGRVQAFTVAPNVTIDNAASDTHTVVEVTAKDRLGLLYDLTRALGRLNLSIASAHIATFGARAVDVFYVKDMFGLKVTNAARCKSIERELLAAIAETQGRPGGKKAAA